MLCTIKNRFLKGCNVTIMKVVFILLLFAFAKEIESLGLHHGADKISVSPICYMYPSELIKPLLPLSQLCIFMTKIQMQIKSILQLSWFR